MGRGLWGHSDFLKLWIGSTVSNFGSQITVLALPLTAVLLLDASPAQMGILGAARVAGWPLIGLFAGVWVDRRSRRRTMILTDLAQALLLGSVPAAALLDVLHIEQLYVVAFAAGLLEVIADVASLSLLPSLLPREQLLDANGRLTASTSAARIAGPAAGGWLVQVLSAPLAIAFDAVSFLVSAVCLSLVRSPSADAVAPRAHGSVHRELWEGLRFVLGSPLLRGMAAYQGTLNFFWAVSTAVYLLYLTNELGFTAALYGLLVLGVAVGALGGSMLARWGASRFPVGRLMVGAGMLVFLSIALRAVAEGPLPVAATVLLIGHGMIGAGNAVLGINQTTIRQAITPARLLGRMNATVRFIMWSPAPLGSLAGGLLGEQIGLRPTLAAAAVGALLGVIWLAMSPIARLKEVPAEASTGVAEEETTA